MKDALHAAAAAAPGASPLVGVAASAGGVAALRELLAALPPSFPAAVLVVVHLQPGRVSHMAEVLGVKSALPVVHAVEGMEPCPAHVYVAPPDRHLVVRADGRLGLDDTPCENYTRPAADPLFASVAACRGAGAVVVVLSGMGHDGARGAQAVAAAGGTVLAQDAATAAHFGMPGSAIATGGVAHVLSPGAIALLLATLFSVPDASS